MNLENLASNITQLYLSGKVEESIDLLLQQKPIDIANLCFLVQRFIENDAPSGQEYMYSQEWVRSLDYYAAKVEE